MPEYILDPHADNDLWQIWQFIARDNPEAATRVVEAAYQTIDALLASPNMGKLRFNLTLPDCEVRSLPVAGFKKYLILYQLTKKGIRVLRVYHTARDIEALFANN